MKAMTTDTSEKEEPKRREYDSRGTKGKALRLGTKFKRETTKSPRNASKLLTFRRHEVAVGHTSIPNIFS